MLLAWFTFCSGDLTSSFNLLLTEFDGTNWTKKSLKLWVSIISQLLDLHVKQSKVDEKDDAELVSTVTVFN